jgi:hypothetical protein
MNSPGAVFLAVFVLAVIVLIWLLSDSGSDASSELSAALGIVLLLAGLAWLLMGHASWVERCESLGGYVHSIYKGKLCLSADGRVLEP